MDCISPTSLSDMTKLPVCCGLDAQVFIKDMTGYNETKPPPTHRGVGLGGWDFIRRPRVNDHQSCQAREARTPQTSKACDCLARVRCWRKPRPVVTAKRGEDAMRDGSPGRRSGEELMGDTCSRALRPSGRRLKWSPEQRGTRRSGASGPRPLSRSALLDVPSGFCNLWTAAVVASPRMRRRPF
ncbi:hypothetical protein ANANG_G00144660 [Anguilla anguilla]|uniref:Uncharacterized protein n=1 Tax=Anguilla anguilla TaxID=7936 RepID=A0A9D3MBG8_ANGAN|nr:hypothetical protein ANANG_G00144660 [Anguilla anguilla]